MKILLATGIFPPQIGGPATYSKLLYDELPKRGIEVEVSNFGDYLDKPKLVRHFLYFRELLKKAQGADVIYALDPVSVGLPALFASQIHRKKLMLRVAGDYAWEQGTQRFGVRDTLDDFARNHSGYSWQVKLFKTVQKYIALGAKRIIVPSAYLKSIVSLWGIDESKIQVIYNGFHMEPIKSTPSILRKKLKWTGKVVISVGRLVPWKGMKELLEIMPAVIQAVPDAFIVIAGDGPERENLVATAKTAGIEDRVVFTGRLNQATLFEYVKAADVFVLNTLYEGFSHQILETMALGTPVITTAVGGNVEIIRNNENGLLIKPQSKEELKDAIIQLLLNDRQATALSRKAKKDVDLFTDALMLDQIEKELKTFVSHS